MMCHATSTRMESWFYNFKSHLPVFTLHMLELLLFIMFIKILEHSDNLFPSHKCLGFSRNSYEVSIWKLTDMVQWRTKSVSWSYKVRDCWNIYWIMFQKYINLVESMSHCSGRHPDYVSRAKYVELCRFSLDRAKAHLRLKRHYETFLKECKTFVGQSDLGMHFSTYLFFFSFKTICFENRIPNKFFQSSATTICCTVVTPWIGKVQRLLRRADDGAWISRSFWVRITWWLDLLAARISTICENLVKVPMKDSIPKRTFDHVVFPFKKSDSSRSSI